MVTKEQAIEWLDMQVEVNKKIRIPLDSIKRIDQSETYMGAKVISSIHVENVRELAKLIDAPIKIIRRDSRKYPIDIYFIYKGCFVFGLEEEK